MIVKPIKSDSLTLENCPVGIVFKALNSNELKSDMHFMKTDSGMKEQRGVGGTIAVVCLESGELFWVSSYTEIKLYVNSNIEIKV